MRIGDHRGADTYDIFLLPEGGGACHHFWTRETCKRFTGPRKKGSEQSCSGLGQEAGEILPTN